MLQFTIHILQQMQGNAQRGGGQCGTKKDINNIVPIKDNENMKGKE